MTEGFFLAFVQSFALKGHFGLFFALNYTEPTTDYLADRRQRLRVPVLMEAKRI